MLLKTRGFLATIGRAISGHPNEPSAAGLTPGPLEVVPAMLLGRCCKKGFCPAMRQ